MFDVTFFFELLEERVDEAGADFFFDLIFELVYDAVAVGGTFIEYSKYVEAVEVAD